MTASDARDRGRTSFQQPDWGDAYAQLSAAASAGSLEPTDLERLAVAAFLIGRERESERHWERAHGECVQLRNPSQAARCAFWLAFTLLNKGEFARAGGWINRLRRLIDSTRRDCAEHGYLLELEALRAIFEGDNTSAAAIFHQAAEIGERFDEADLATLARHGQGRALVRLGQRAEGMALLDEAMVAVTAGEVSPIVAGDVYCSTIEACQELFDVRRAQEWTATLSEWCESQPALVPYRGQCLVHRAEILQLRGAWPDALEQARRACEWLSQPPIHPAIGAAFYRRAELHRLRSEFDQAEHAYRQAGRAGREPQPGLALLWLAQNKVEAAASAIGRLLSETRGPVQRAGLLAASVEIMLAAGDVQAAQIASVELSDIAAEFDAVFLDAVSAHCRGAVMLRDSDAHAALQVLREAEAAWLRLNAPYEAARTRILISLACQQLGDVASAELELDAARLTFESLGAASDLRHLESLRSESPSVAEAGLTAREAEVIRLVAAGKTNRAIAAELVISEKTVARHVSNAFCKLNVSSRAAATAYAYEHQLVQRRT
jgi:DNA-binding NarL/FixJ family response regulator